MVLLNPMKKILIADSVKAIVEKKKSILSRSDFTILTAVSCMIITRSSSVGA